MRFVILGLAAVCIVGLAVPRTSAAKGGAEKVRICHVNSANEPGVLAYRYTWARHTWRRYWPYYHYFSSGDQTITRTWHLGRVIEVDPAAVDAHLAAGDSVFHQGLSDAMAADLESLEDTQDRYESYSYGSWYYRVSGWYRQTYDRDVTTNAVVKNANCYWSTTDVVDN